MSGSARAIPRVEEAVSSIADPRDQGGDAPRHTSGTALLDDEPETEEERAAVAEARAEFARGEGIPAAEIYREFGL